MDAEYYYQFLETIDERAAEVSDTEARFIEDMLKNRPQQISHKQVKWIQDMAMKYLGERVE